MKKKFYMLLMALSMIVTSGCSNTANNSTSETLEDGTHVIHSDSGDSYFLEDLPYEITYDDTSFVFKNVDFYEDSVGYETYLYAVVYFDMNNMTDEERYWFQKEYEEAISEYLSPLLSSIYITSEKNEIDFEPMEKIYEEIFSNNYRIAVFKFGPYQHSLSEQEFFISIDVNQGGTYESENSDGELTEYDKSDNYSLSGDFPSTLPNLEDFQNKAPSVFEIVLGNTSFSSDSQNSESSKDSNKSENENNSSGSSNTEDSSNISLERQNALRAAKNYLSVMPFSYSGLIEQLEYEGYSTEDATYAADNCGADWNEQAALKAQSYIDMTSFSRQGLIDQLIFEGFTQEQAEYGVSAVGY